MRWWLVSTAVIVAVSGCRNNAQLDAHLELMNAERRALEDELYELEYDYEALAQKLKDTQSDNERLRSELDEPASDFLDLSPGREADASDEMPDLDLSPPKIEPGVPSTRATEPEISYPVSVLGSSRRSPGLIRQPLDTTRPAGGSVSHIYIDPVLTRIHDFDHQPGPDGLAVVIEPRDDSGAFVPSAGAVSVVLLDYAQRRRGPAARVARWDLNVEQTREFLHDSAVRRGIHLELRWPDRPPQQARFRMDIRFTTEDGRQLETRQDISVDAEPGSLVEYITPQPASPTGPRVARGWTPRSARSTNRRVAGGQASPTMQPGPPWSLEQAAGDAIRRNDSNSTAGQRRIARPEWKPYR